jgi:hypothetical protein
MGLLSPTLSSKGGEGEKPARGFSGYDVRIWFGASSPRPSPPEEERESRGLLCRVFIVTAH